MNKRGQEDKLLFTIWEFIAAAMVIMIILVSVRGLANNTNYWKKYYSTDIALIANIEGINQGDFVMNYALKDQKYEGLAAVFLRNKFFEIELEDKRINVYDSPDRGKFQGTFPFAAFPGMIINKGSVVSDYIEISKIDDTITLNRYSGAGQLCPPLNTKKTSDMKFTIISLDPEVNNFASTMQAISRIEGGSGPDFVEEALIFVKSTDENQIVFYSYDDLRVQKSRKMACLLKNNVIIEGTESSWKDYDGFLDSDSSFTNAYAAKDTNQYVLIMLIPESVMPKSSEVLTEIKNTFKEYYK